MLHNLLTQSLITVAPLGPVTLPGLFAALARDAVDFYPAQRPHQMPAWHMFTVQLAALALLRGQRTAPPETDAEWLELLRGLTRDYPDDAPWSLVVDDAARPAFLQSPVPEGVVLKGQASTPDALDLLITSKSHDLKQAVARLAAAEDWVFALVSLQTGEGYGGAGNHGIARMNGGSSSRALLGLAPAGAGMAPRPGAWWRRDLAVLARARETLLDDNNWDYAETGGIGLTWLAPWPEGNQLQLRQLDPWFIEICRRVRLRIENGRLSAAKGTSAAARIDAKIWKGRLGDPWAPIHAVEGKSLTLGDGDFDYRRMVDLLTGGWRLPAAARSDPGDGALVLVAAALARGNSRTDGYRQRRLPMRADVAVLLAANPALVGEMAKGLVVDIDTFGKALRSALALAAAGGDADRRGKGDYRFAEAASAGLDRFADAHFFQTLWAMLAPATDAVPDPATAARELFVRMLWAQTRQQFEAALPEVPCQSLLRPRAAAQARRMLWGSAMKHFGDTLRSPKPEEVDDAA